MSPFWMPSSDTLDPTLQSAIEDAVARALRENSEWLRDLVQDALVEAANAEARREDERRAAHADVRRAFPVQHGQA